MAVPCGRCGREYDVTLFEFGRTLWCTCGARVGLEPRRRPLAGPERRFLADAMLGRLARWLRLLGVDCAFEPDVSDAALVRRALEEGRIVLTRDRSLPAEWRVSDVHLVEAEILREQLAEVIRHFGLVPELRLFSRCSDCNAPLVPVAASELGRRVPARVLERHTAFVECPRCTRVYWEGTHTERIRRFVEELVARTLEIGRE